MQNNEYNVISELNKLYNNEDKKSLSDILTIYSQITPDYIKLYNENNKKYSSYIYNECTADEQNEFIDDQLQFIECLVMNSIYNKSGIIWNWSDIYNLMHDDEYKNVDKMNRKVVFSTSNINRPVGDSSYNGWNGLQIIDLDIKNYELADNLKPKIFNDLKKYNWFLGVCKSASQKSLHVWTKIKPISMSSKNRKTEFLCNFRHKYSAVYTTLLKYHSELGYNKENIVEYMDMAMGKPQQGIYISSDNNALLNTNFIDKRLDVNFETAFDGNISSISWISHPDLKEIFKKLEWYSNDVNENDKVEISNISNINERDTNKSLGPKHYKHAQRWQLANTLTYIYGEEKALSILFDICKDVKRQELRSDIRTAAVHNKPISTWAIRELNYQHGFKLKIKSNNVYEDDIAKIDETLNNAKENEDPTKIINNSTKQIELHINHKQYLSDIKDSIIQLLGKITLLEAGAGYGKTEMIKQLGKRTLLILPFTSTIKAKVEADSNIVDWDYYYANKRPTIEDILGNNNMAMTIDKFSRLNIFELNASNIEYVVIDESHLLFMSQYRAVMSGCIQRLANCNKKVIMMTGTPTGETIFFPGITHIKVIKEDFREKEFNIHMCTENLSMLVLLAKNIAKDIYDDKKILFPTNKGMLYYDQLVGLIQKECDIIGLKRQIKHFYYKKSNTGDEVMDDINIDKTIGNADFICCSTYLSVGVDICDRYTFSVYFDELWVAQDMEQFANRIRNNNLYIHLWLPREDTSGLPINYKYVKPLDLSLKQDDLITIRDNIKMYNDMIERNQDEFKQNPIIQYMLSTNQYIKYDENDCRYYIDETQYKLMLFEQNYKEYAKQLKVLITNMKDYGYVINHIEHSERINDEEREEKELYIKSLRHLRFNYITTQTFDLLNHINDNNIDFYRNLGKGSYEMFKSDEYKIERENNQIYTQDIEIMEKNLPIILSLYKYYDCDTIRKIFEYCVDTKQNKINYTKLKRIRTFANIESNRRKKRLDFPVLKYIKDAQKWSLNNSIVTQNDIDKFIKEYTVKYANSIPDLVVEDVKFLEDLYETMCELWKVIIVQSRPSKGNIKISPFELLWEQKIDLKNIFDGVETTKEFFIDDLINNMNNETIIEDDEDIPDYIKTQKTSIEKIKDEIPNIVHKEFEYNIYSELDGSNERFLRKQRNTNKINNILIKEEPTLFDEDDAYNNISNINNKYIDDLFENII